MKKYGFIGGGNLKLLTTKENKLINIERMIQEFNLTYKPDDISPVPRVPMPKDQELFGGLIVEEIQELALGFDNGDPVEIFDAICDIIYVTWQQANLHGYPVAEGLKEVHRSNMSKLQDGKPLLREDGKVLKGDQFSEPNLTEVLRSLDA